MTVEIMLVLAVVVAALVLFATQWLPVDITALLVLLVLMVIPFVGQASWLQERGIDLPSAFPTVAEGLSGLSNPATVTVLAMFMLSAGVQASGLIHVVANRLAPLIGSSELRLIVVIGVVVGLLSGFINNTAAVAVAMPMVIDLTRRLGLRASRILMPLSFFAQLGGMLTLIGTSTSILASSLLREEQAFGRDLRMFEFSALGALGLGVGLLYFVTVGRLLLPSRDEGAGAEDGEQTFLVELMVPGDSDLVGQTLAEAEFEARAGVDVVRLSRDAAPARSGAPAAGQDAGRADRDPDEVTVEAGDVLLVRATPIQVMDLADSETVQVVSDLVSRRRITPDDDSTLVRVLLKDRRWFNGRAARDVDLAGRVGGRLVGVEMARPRADRLAEERLHVGEIVLVQVPTRSLERLRRRPEIILLDEFDNDFGTRQMWIAGSVLAGVVGVAALTPLPIVVSALVGVVVMVLTGVLRKEDMYPSVSWDVIFLLAGMIPLGIALTKSGAADGAASLLSDAASGWHPLVVLLALYLATTILTELVSNNATVVIAIPVAVALADSLGIDVLAVALVVIFAASTSFLSPIGYQTNTMVFGTGLYRFTDFARVGAPLNVLLMGVTCVALWWWLLT